MIVERAHIDSYLYVERMDSDGLELVSGVPGDEEGRVWLSHEHLKDVVALSAVVGMVNSGSYRVELPEEDEDELR